MFALTFNKIISFKLQKFLHQHFRLNTYVPNCRGQCFENVYYVMKLQSSNIQNKMVNEVILYYLI